MQRHGTAFRMRHELAQLAERFGTPSPQPHLEPPLPCCDGRMTLCGLATTPAVDLERTRFRRHALGWLPWRMPLLQYRHQPDAIGEITALEWAEDGLRIACVTDHALAKCSAAFSVTATIYEYQMRNIDQPNYHAEVTSGWLESVSLTAQPANPHALVMHRYPVSVYSEFARTMLDRIDALKLRVQQEFCHGH